VIDGPFKDFNGVVEEVNYEKKQIKNISAHFWPVNALLNWVLGRLKKADSKNVNITFLLFYWISAWIR